MRRLAVVINPAVFQLPKSIKRFDQLPKTLIVFFIPRVINDQRGNSRVLV
jgi:hypothetical protein